jgi:type VI protein secretion system component VasA
MRCSCARVAAWAEGDRSGRWVALPAIPIHAAGFDEDDALIDFPARSHPAYRLLTEYFCFPEKFNFFDIDLAALAPPCPPAPNRSRCTWPCPACARLEHGAHARHLSTNNVLLGCTPVVNLFRQKGEPIRLTHTSASYPVLADARRAFAFEVQAIDSVSLVRQTPQGETVVQFRPSIRSARPDARAERPLLGHAARRDAGRAQPRLRDPDHHRRYRFRSGRGRDRHPEPGTHLHQPRPAVPARLWPARRRPVPRGRLEREASASCASPPIPGASKRTRRTGA